MQTAQRAWLGRAVNGQDDVTKLDHSFYPSVARFHSALHAASKHGRSRLGIGQGHTHGHEGAGTIWIETRFNAVAGRRVGQVHPLDVDDH